MIQDIEPKIFKNQFLKKNIKSGDVVFVFREDNVFLKKNRDCPFYLFDDFTVQADFVYLFSIDDRGYFLCMDEKVIEHFSDGEFLKVKETRSLFAKEDVFAISSAYHLYVWYRDNRFCGRCGKKTFYDEKLRMLKCVCGNCIFPKIAPAVIVGITNGNKILLTRYANRTYKRYALVAGFTEFGETAEMTVKREVMEEVGIEVKNIKYYKSQPWGFDSNLLLGYFCELSGSDKITMDREELSVAEWVSREDIPEYNEGLSLTQEMMLLFKHSDDFNE